VFGDESFQEGFVPLVRVYVVLHLLEGLCSDRARIIELSFAVVDTSESRVTSRHKRLHSAASGLVGLHQLQEVEMVLTLVTEQPLLIEPSENAVKDLHEGYVELLGEGCAKILT
jgi:hypothetical protein